MKKLLKFMSLLLIVPMLGIGSLLTGCGKDEASIQDIKNDYNEMIKTYHIDTSDENKLSASENKLFTYSGDVTLTTEKTYNYFKDGKNITFAVDLEYLDMDNDDTFVNDATGELQKRYIQLEQIYAKMLNYSNLYFERYQQEFFEEPGNEDLVDKEEVYKLREKLDNLSNKVEAFYTNWRNSEALAEFLGTNTEIMQTKLNAFNSVYADLIEANFEFVLKFCDIHKNYILNADQIGANAENHPLIAERTAYEAELKYAYGYFMYYVKAFQHNGICNTIDLGASNKDDMEETYYTYVVYTNAAAVLSKGDYDYNKLTFKTQAEYDALADKTNWNRLVFYDFTIKRKDVFLWFDGEREETFVPSEFGNFLDDNEKVIGDNQYSFNRDNYQKFYDKLNDTKKAEFKGKCNIKLITATEYDAMIQVLIDYRDLTEQMMKGETEITAAELQAKILEVEEVIRVAATYEKRDLSIIPDSLFAAFIDSTTKQAKKFTTSTGELTVDVQLDCSLTSQMKQHIARLDQFTKLYKSNLDSFDIYTYNLVRIGSKEALYDSVKEFTGTLSDSEMAQYTMIEEYANYDLPLMENAIKLFLNVK